jgi:hypothetical protein
MRDERDHREHDENVNEAARDMERQKPESPTDQQDDTDRKQHWIPPGRQKLQDPCRSGSAIAFRRAIPG